MLFSNKRTIKLNKGTSDNSKRLAEQKSKGGFCEGKDRDFQSMPPKSQLYVEPEI